MGGVWVWLWSGGGGGGGCMRGVGFSPPTPLEAESWPSTSMEAEGWLQASQGGMGRIGRPGIQGPRGLQAPFASRRPFGPVRINGLGFSRRSPKSRRLTTGGHGWPRRMSARWKHTRHILPRDHCEYAGSSAVEGDRHQRPRLATASFGRRASGGSYSARPRTPRGAMLRPMLDPGRMVPPPPPPPNKQKKKNITFYKNKKKKNKKKQSH